MTHLSISSKTFRFPDSSETIDIVPPAQDRPAPRQYKAPYPQPPSGQLDAKGLKARMTWCTDRRSNRDISPRTMRFIQYVKDTAEKMLKMPGGKKKGKKAEKMEVMDGALQSRWQLLHDKGGLCDTLTEQFASTLELRLKAQYGDYFAHVCGKEFKSEAMNDLKWKVEKKNWQEVSALLKKEEEKKSEEEWVQDTVLSPTPWLATVETAAARLEMDPALMTCMIHQYAERNNWCHSGITKMIDGARFNDLSHQLMQDKRHLAPLYRDRPQDKKLMLDTINYVQRKWFDSIMMEDDGKIIRAYILTPEGKSRILQSVSQGVSVVV